MHLPKELQALVDRQNEYKQLLAELNELSGRLDDIIRARRAGNVQMQLPVELGHGYQIEGVVPDTKIVRLSLGAGVWYEMAVEDAREHVRLRKEMTARWIDAMEPQIVQQREDWDFTKDKLRQALAGI